VNKTFLQLIQDLEDYLIYQQDRGAKVLEADRELVEELGKVPERLSSAPAPSVQTCVPELITLDGSEPLPEFQTLEEIAMYVSKCRRCGLYRSRNCPVPGEGNPDHPDVMFIGEGPGVEEDAQGRPFIGRAGQLLTKMIAAMGYRREDVYIANIVKCRPPGNRAPVEEEMRQCLPYLQQQIRLIRPKIIIALGGTAIKGLLGKTPGITRMRGKWQKYEGIDLMPTFHPSYLLRDPSKKKPVWEDLKAVLHRLGKEPPPRRRG